MTEEEWLASHDRPAMCHFLATAKNHWRTRWLGWIASPRFSLHERHWRAIDLGILEESRCLTELPFLEELLPFARLQARERLVGASLESALLKVARLLVQLQTGVLEHLPYLEAVAFEVGAALGRLFGRGTEEGMLCDLAEVLQTRVIQARGGAAENNALLKDWARLQADVVREVVGNPFRPVAIDPDWLAASGGAVRHLLEVIALEERFGELPILADALEDAGCCNEAILRHCRESGRHRYGCWVIDQFQAHLR